MKKILSVLFTAAFIACGAPADKSSIKEEALTEVIVKGEAQGTTYTIKYINEEVLGIKQEVDSLLKAIDLSMSTYIPNSSISKLNEGDTVQVDEMFKKVYALSIIINGLTGGAFDPTIGPLIKAWGFDYSNPQKMDSSLVKELLNNSGFKQFKTNEDKQDNTIWKLNPKARINFNAIAQGYSVDLMCKILDDRGIQNYYVELGGELKVKGKNKFNDWWVIGIDQPSGENLERKLAIRVSLENAAMATSGNYRKFYEVDGKKYSHTLNPRTGYPAENSLLSATVIARDAATADGLATAFMVMGVEKAKVYLMGYPDIQAHLIYINAEGKYETFTSSKLKEKILKD